ncbi:MAG: hypothetical protein LBS66_02255 [Rhodospirillaceae bacterium]|jgi:hypothetical protein|nr:hypothetical protein [Rhodospirillaceae bacterium]
MKARAVVFTHIEKPATIFSLPSKMVAVTLACTVLVFIITLVTDLMAFSMLAAGFTTISGLILSYYLGRKDHHIETLLLLSLIFWRFRKTRWFLAGSKISRNPKRTTL